MSGISSGIGLISGIDIASVVDQLMALQERPVRTLEARVQTIDIRKTAFLAISARLLSIQNAGVPFARPSFFRTFSANSSDESSLQATASDTASPGNHTFRVHSLVGTHTMLSRGFSSADADPIGVGSITIEIGNGRVNPRTELSTLNGGAGVRRGIIQITDRAGITEEIDLTTAFTIEDVLEAINSNTTLQVRASVTGMASHGATGDRIVIEDLTPDEQVIEQGRLSIADVGGGSTAIDLGIATDSAPQVTTARVDGRDLVRLTNDTPLSLLNDGNGVSRFRGLEDDLIFTTSDGYADFNVRLNDILEPDVDLRALNGGNGVRLGTIRITDRGEKSAEIDLSSARTVQDIRDAIQAADVDVSVTMVNAHFLVNDASGAEGGNFIIEDVTGHAAADLGIAADAEESSITGRDIYRINTLGDVLNAINYASDNVQAFGGPAVRASISSDGKGLALEALGIGNSVTVGAGENASTGLASQAAADLGLLGATHGADDPIFTTRRLIAGLGSVLLGSLDGGSGIGTGVVSFTDRDGNTSAIDFASAGSLADVVDLINADETLSLRASINPANNGIIIRDESGGLGSLVIQDTSGTLAADLGIAVDDLTMIEISSGNLQLQYISRESLLSDLNGGRGVTAGDFRMTDSLGRIHSVSIPSNRDRLGDVIDAINRSADGAFEARINDTGDGIAVIDLAGGTNQLTIEDINGGRMAEDLRLAGTARTGETMIDGSYEFRIEINATDTLDDVVLKLNEAGGDFTASILNDGGAVNPYSLTITSGQSGRTGEMMIDTGDVNLGLDTLAQAQNAIVTIGEQSGAGSLVISSATNTLDNVIEGLTIDLLSVSDEPVTLSVAQDIDAIVGAINTFVSAYNDTQGEIDTQTRFDQETLTRGPLLGDNTVSLIRARLHRMMGQSFEGVDPSVARLSFVGIRLSGGNRLEFDEQKFRDAYAEKPRLIEELFTLEETGFGAAVEETLTSLTRDFDGVLAIKSDLFDDQQQILNNRIDNLNELLALKRARLEAEFIGLESALAGLQNQQNALASLSQLAVG